ncbi:MAG: MFS transporter, partial [Actinomycetota bacterium]
GVVALVALPHGVRSRGSEENRGEALRSLRADRPFVVFLGASVLAAFVYFQLAIGLPLHVSDSGLSTAVYGFLISLNGIIIVLIELPLVRFVRRFPAPKAIAAGMSLTAVGFGLTAVSHDLVPLVLTVVIWTFGEMMAAPTSSAYVAAVAPTRLRGRYQGAFGLTFAVAAILGPVVGTGLYAWSPTSLWVTCAVAGLVAAGLVVRLPSRKVAPDYVEPPDLGPELPGVER